MSGDGERRAAVTGAGVMGAGIALVFSGAGWRVGLHDPSPAALDAARTRIDAGLRFLGHEPAPILQRIRFEEDLAAAVDGADIAIEAGPERLEVKQEIFARLEGLGHTQTVLASNTSAIPIRDISARMRQRDRVLGTHFWNPPHLVRLVEVIQGDETDPAVVDSTMATLLEVGMRPVHVKVDVPGFVGNRLQHALKREAIALVAAGVCDAETVDTVVKLGFGARLPYIGPLEQSDLSGLTLTLAIHEVLMPHLDVTPVAHPLLVEKVAAGETGAAVGKGFREWAPGEAEALRARVYAALRDSLRD